MWPLATDNSMSLQGFRSWTRGVKLPLESENYAPQHLHSLHESIKQVLALLIELKKVLLPIHPVDNCGIASSKLTVLQNYW